MTLSHMLEKLNFPVSELSPEIQNRSFYHVEFLPDAPVWQPDTFYLAESVLEGLPDFVFCMVRSDKSCVSQKHPNRIFLHTEKTIEQLRDTIREAMLEDYSVLDAQLKISKYFTRMNLLEEIIEQISAEIAMPLAVFDCTGKILAVSRSFWEMREDLREQQDAGYILLENFKKMQEDQIFAKISKNDSNCYIDQSGGKHHLWYHASILRGSTELAYFAAVSDEAAFSAKQLRIFEFIQMKLSQHLSQPVGTDELRNIKYSQFFLDLMDGTINSLGFLDYRLKILGWSPKTHFSLLTVYSDAPIRRPLITASLILKFFHDKKYFFYEDAILFVLDYDEIKNIHSCLNSSYFLQMMENNALQGTLSREFDSLLELRNSYEQSQTLRRVGSQTKPGETLYAYTHYMFPIMLDSVQQHMNLDDFIHPMIQNIYQYDLDHGTDFLETLCAYLMAPKDSAKSAEMLNVHKNTFNYRINRVRELYNLDLADGDLCFRLLFSIQILEFKYKISILQKYKK